MYKLTGEIKVINDTVQVSDSFRKREFVVVDAKGEYPQFILLQLIQDRCEVLDKFKVGEQVEVSFFLNGREWTNPKDNTVKYFNSLQAWKIDYAGEHADALHGQELERQIAEGDDDLSF